MARFRPALADWLAHGRPQRRCRAETARATEAGSAGGRSRRCRPCRRKAGIVRTARHGTDDSEYACTCHLPPALRRSRHRSDAQSATSPSGPGGPRPAARPWACHLQSSDLRLRVSYRHVGRHHAARPSVPACRSAVASARDEPPVEGLRHGWGYVPALDGVRALAIIAVMAHHLSLAGRTVGLAGVDVFFVLRVLDHHPAARRGAA